MSGGSSSSQHPPRRFPSLWHLLCLSIITFLTITGHVSLQNTAVVVLSTLYLLLLSTFSFPSIPTSSTSPIFPSSKILPIYVLFAGVAGLLLPLLYILHGIYFTTDNHHAAAAPHLFLLAAQVVMEGVAFAAQFSVPVRAFVPVFYNSWRIPVVFEWARTEMMTERSTAYQMGIGRGLALINLVLWSYNLFGFLLPVYLPRAFKRYYSSPTTKVE